MQSGSGSPKVISFLVHLSISVIEFINKIKISTSVFLFWKIITRI